MGASLLNIALVELPGEEPGGLPHKLDWNQFIHGIDSDPPLGDP